MCGVRLFNEQREGKVSGQIQRSGPSHGTDQPSGNSTVPPVASAILSSGRGR